MYLYVTSNVNMGHKIGITENLLKRKNQYNTIFPDLDMIFSVYTNDAEAIEQSFKYRFRIYRKLSGSTLQYSEIYTLYWQYIAEHIIRCFHAKGQALVISHEELSSEWYETPRSNSINYYISDHYFALIRGEKIKYTVNYGIKPTVYVGNICPRSFYQASDSKQIDNKFKYVLRHINFEGLKKKIQSSNKENYLNLEKEEKKNFLETYGQPEEVFCMTYWQAINILREEIFKILVETKIIKRPYNMKLLDEESTKIMSYAKRYYKDKIFFGKPFHMRSRRGGHKKGNYFRLGTVDESSRKNRRENYFPKTLNKNLGDGFD